MRNIIIGTAGHIDHGKTTLIKALTGIETDRLKEEKKRGITIELGFAFFKLPNGKKAGIVDVPGHERFIKNMLAGVSGIDLVLLVVAADEGVMPQTQEHLDILSILDVKKGIVVLTKSDLVDEEWLMLVKEDLAHKVKGTFLEKAPVVCVSSLEGTGINELKEYITKLTEEVPEKNISQPLRLPIDRVFTLSGFGTIVTGTLIEGTVKEKESLMIYPKGLEVKVRNIQVHGNSVDKAYAGQRVALNLTGIKKEDISRGDILAAENSMKGTMIIDVKLNLLKNSSRKIEHWSRLRFYHGTKEILCRVVLLDRDELNPGESCYAQLRLEEETACKYGDRFVVRFYSPLETIGGGVILDPNAVKHKRSNEDIINELKVKSEGNNDIIIESALKKFSNEFPDIRFISVQTGLSEKIVKESFIAFIQQKLAVEFSNGRFVHRDFIEKYEEQIISFLSKFHKKYPLKQGVSKEEIKSRFFKNTRGKLFDEIIEIYKKNGIVNVFGDKVALKGFEIQLSSKQTAIKDRITKIYRDNGFKPPMLKDVLKSMDLDEKDKDIIDVMIDMNILIKVSEDILFHIDVYSKAKEALKKHLVENKEITLAQFRDILNTSRKYVVPLLEHFDAIKFTKRIDDKRVLYN
ncbi:selenocysteine-specific translation elongation factor [Paramaledivibacter caminithermalis]|jgi:selenocysteine-specific elongation factor|uniref:Selenocysteine-specific elongation factor n=1 Tax=Paramaledivibacter caminithermalis (strain DSM 15212 / CIP 107654 / DViRD3) TaxID=1121301 RepID=A0A1M6MGQ4_PARC5|nr:selenocysteine-specific translation elongation factor [Paramaledivibacter caminithermalis]SHJ82652.1 selenocysteine-specific elongation factor [Paramaledivibacter caminithermalis DSM 15212]